ncbi:MAG: CxxC-x17-CxxC domain-containing protein [Nanoarchaeota archaeon]
MGYDKGNRGSGGHGGRGGRGGGNRGGGGGFGGRGGGGFSGPREMHKAVCDECKKECEVPFKPTEGKPVYCKECYAKHKKY